MATFASKAQESQANIIFDAVEKNQIDRIQSMIEGGTDVNIQDVLRNTPMHMAAFYGREKVIDLLAKNGGDVNAVNQAGRTPLYSAVQANHLQAVQALIKHKANPNAKIGQSRETVLHLACSSGRFQIAEALLEGGADPKVRDADGKTPGDYAKAKGDKALVKLLKDKRWR